MVNYYTRPDGAHVRLDTEAGVVVNVLNIDNSKVIAHFQHPDYIANVVSMTQTFTPSTEEAFRNAIQEAKDFILNL